MIPKLAAHSDLFSKGKRASGSTLPTGGGFLLRYQTLVLGLALGLIYSNLPIYGYTLNPGILPKFTFFGIFFLVAPFMLVRSRAFGAYLLTPFVLWAVFFFLLNLIHLVIISLSNDWKSVYHFDQHAAARQALIATRIQYIVFAVFLGFFAYISPHKNYLYALSILMVVIPCAVLVDFARPGLLYSIGTEGAVLGRAAAMFINPTMAGEAILLVFLIGCSITPGKYRVPLFLLAGAGVIATFSRSSILAWILIFFILVAKRSLPKSALVTIAAMLGLLLIFVGSFESYLDSRNDLADASSNIVSRLDFFSSFKLDDDSSEERADVIRAGWELFLQNPLFGAGAGATQFWSYRGSTHNQLLLLAAEYGLFGIGLWIWLLVILVKGRFFADRGLQIATAFLFVFMSLFTHQMFDSATYWLATFALVSVRKTRAPPFRSGE